MFCEEGIVIPLVTSVQNVHNSCLCIRWTFFFVADNLEAFLRLWHILFLMRLSLSLVSSDIWMTEKACEHQVYFKGCWNLKCWKEISIYCLTSEKSYHLSSVGKLIQEVAIPLSYSTFHSMTALYQLPTLTKLYERTHSVWASSKSFLFTLCGAPEIEWFFYLMNHGWNLKVSQYGDVTRKAYHVLIMQSGIGLKAFGLASCDVGCLLAGFILLTAWSQLRAA